MKQRRNQQPHAGAVAQLAALTAAPHPDAALILACDRLTVLVEWQHALFRLKGTGSRGLRKAFLLAHDQEMLRLYVGITRMEPRTLHGQQVRAAAALHAVPDKNRRYRRALLALLGAVGPVEIARQREAMAALLPDIWSGGIIGEFVHAAIGGLVHAAREVTA